MIECLRAGSNRAYGAARTAATEQRTIGMKQVIWAGALFGLMAAGAVLYGAVAPQPAHSQAAGGGQGVPIRVATAVTKPTPVEFNTIGSVQTIASVAVKSRL